MNKKRKKINLKEVFLKLQEQMITKLNANREIINHPGAKGNASELNWINLLNTYLPDRYKVNKAFILDSQGNISEQIDIVIYDRHYSPFLFFQDNAIYIPSESVYAILEVKQSINKDSIEYAGSKAKSVRKLKRTSISIPHAGGQYKPKKHFEILAGILALDSEWNPPLGSSLNEVLLNLSGYERLNFGCVLNSGGFEARYGKETIIIKSERNESLIFFFLKLLEKLQKLGTIPAMDISEYGRVIE